MDYYQCEVDFILDVHSSDENLNAAFSLLFICIYIINRTHDNVYTTLLRYVSLPLIGGRLEFRFRMFLLRSELVAAVENNTKISLTVCTIYAIAHAN